MKRLLNFRAPFILAIALAAGIALSLIFVRNDLNVLWIIAALPVSAVIFILCAAKRKSFAPVIIFAFAVLFFVFGAVICHAKLSAYAENQLQDDGVYSFTATVSDRGQNSSGEYLIIKNIRADGKRVDGKAKINLPEIYGDYCEAGYKVTFTAMCIKQDTFTYGKLNYNVQNNVKYNFTLFGKIKAERGFSLFGSVRNAAYSALYDNLDTETAAIAYAMLTGNAQGVEESAMQTFRYGGIAHVFAVSGLHIGIIFGVISFILKKLKLNKYLSAAVCVTALFFYSGVCGFTLSSVRAAIMCAVTVAARLLYNKYDGLNSLSLSAIIILTLFPLSLFSVGFRLSVCAVLGILLLSKNIARLLRKIKLPEKFCSAASVSVGAQAATMPVMLASFGYISGAGLVLNIIIIPVLSVIFQIIFGATVFCMVFTFAAPFVIPAAALPLKALVSFLVGAGFEKALISGFGAGAFTAFYFMLLLSVSDKINMKATFRAVSAGGTAIMLLAYTLVSAFAPVDGYKISVSAYYGGGQVLIKHGGKDVLIVTQNINTGQMKQFLSANYTVNPDAVIILGDEDCATFYGELGIDCNNVFVYGNYAPVQPYGSFSINYAAQFELFGTKYEFAEGKAVTADCGGVTVGMCAGEAVIENCDVYIGEAANLNCAAAIYFNSDGAEFSVYDGGDIRVRIENGKYTIK